MKKIYLIYTFIFFIIGLFVWRLYYLQLATDRYKLNAINTSIKQEILYPNRVDILDRIEKLLVSNTYSYELNVVPGMMKESFDVLAVCQLAGLVVEELL